MGIFRGKWLVRSKGIVGYAAVPSYNEPFLLVQASKGRDTCETV